MGLDPATLTALASLGPIGVFCAMWIVTARSQSEERRQWMEQSQKERTEWLVQVTRVIEANTAALSRTATALGEVSASRMTCPAAGAYDERGDAFRRRRTNGRLDEQGMREDER